MKQSYRTLLLVLMIFLLPVFTLGCNSSSGETDVFLDGEVDQSLVPPPIILVDAPTMQKPTLMSSGNRVDLTWTTPTSYTSFDIERSGNGGMTWSNLVTALPGNRQEYSDTGPFVSNTTYSYRMRAWVNGKYTPYSNIVSATTKPEAIPVPDAPTMLIVTALSSTEMNISWTDNADNETNFVLQRSEDGGFSWSNIVILRSNSTIYTDNGLTANTMYTYRVFAKNAGGSSMPSNMAAATTKPEAIPVPDAPTMLIVTPLSSSEIKLSWTDNGVNEISFMVQRSLNNGVTWSNIATLSANSTMHADSGLIANTMYTYRVFAKNAGGSSMSSNVAAAPTLPPPVVNNPPQVWFVSLQPGASGQAPLIKTRMPTHLVIGVSDDHDQIKCGEIFIDGVLQSSTPLEILLPSFDIMYMEVDFTGKPDGFYTLSVEVCDDIGQPAQESIVVEVNRAQLRKEGLVVLRFGMSTFSRDTYRWTDTSLPISVRVNTLFSSTEFTRWSNEAAWVNRYLIGKDLYKVLWGDSGIIDTTGCTMPETLSHAIHVQPAVVCNPAFVGGALERKYNDGTVGFAVININMDLIVKVNAPPEKLNVLFAHELMHTLPMKHLGTFDIMHNSPSGTSPWRKFISPQTSEAYWILYNELQPGDPIPLS